MVIKKLQERILELSKKHKLCEICNNPLKKGAKKYHLFCYTKIAQKGRTPWNKGKKTGIIPKTAFRKGIRFNPKGEFKKGIGKSFIGTIAEYKNLHYWVNKELGKPLFCELCDATSNLEWANKSHTYQRLLSDWIGLCKKCHYAYDRNYDIRTI